LEILKGSAKKTLARYLREYADHVNLVLKSEKPFEYLDRDTGALISGTIDLLERVETTPEGERVEIPVALVEFKTQKWRELAEFLERKGEAEIQLGIYASASRRSLGLDPRMAAAHFLSPAGPNDELRRQGVTERVEVDVSDAQQERIRTMIRDAVLDIKRGMGANDFARSGCARGRCPKCDFRLICPGYIVHARTGSAPVRPRTIEEERDEELNRIEEDASE
jgi:DNA helicase-2/ATP-dependent DNA helicase PcrA